MALTVAFAGDDGDAGMMGEAVQGGRGEQCVPEDLRPLRRGAVGGEENGAALVTTGDQLVEILRPLRAYVWVLSSFGTPLESLRPVPSPRE
jgi:hypothetical protein